MVFSLAVLRDPDAARIFAGQAISQTCDKMMTVGLVWVIAAGGQLRLVPWFLAVGALPHLLLARFTGGWVERLGPLRAVIGSDVARFLAYLLACLGWLAWPKFGVLFAVTLLANCASALFNPAILSLPMLLPKARSGLLGQLTAMIDSCFSLGNIFGPLVAALLYPWLGLPGLLGLNALSYLLAAWLSLGVHLAPAGEPPGGAAPTEGGAERVPFGRDGLTHFLLGAFFFMNLALTPMIAFLPLFAKARFHGEIGVLAGLETFLGLGTVCGSVALTLYSAGARTGPRLIASTLTIAGMYLAFALSARAEVAFAALFVLGLALSVVNVTLLTFFQCRPLETDVPRVMSLVNLISVGVIPLSMTLVGGLVERLDLGNLAAGCACLLFILALLTALNPEVRSA